MQNDNFTMALSYFINALAVPLTRRTLHDDLQKHPDWYKQKQKKYKEWANVHPKIGNVTSFKTLVKQREWCNLTNVVNTLVIFINGRKLSQLFT